MCEKLYYTIRTITERERESEKWTFIHIEINWTDISARNLGPTQNVCVCETNYVETDRQKAMCNSSS
jgi:hypothetical protein